MYLYEQETSISIEKNEAYNWLNAMEDPVRVVGPSEEILFQNSAMDRIFEQLSDPSYKLFPLSMVDAVFEEGISKMTEFCVGEVVFSVRSSPVIEGDKTTSVIQVFRDITDQNDLALKLYEDNQRMQEDMRFARSIQDEMLPKLTNYGPFSFHYRYIPTNELSGDFFDLVPSGQGQISLYIADVVGHGISASILTMFVRQTMRSILLEEKIRQPAHVLKRLKNRFSEISMAEDQYLTVFYALFDLEKHLVTYANAGHNCLPLYKSKGKVEELKAKGMIISSFFNNHDYHQYERSFKKGDRFLFYTDGATEACNASGQAFGEERLKTIMEETGENLLEKLSQTIHHYQYGEQKDDIALLQVDCLS